MSPFNITSFYSPNLSEVSPRFLEILLVLGDRDFGTFVQSTGDLGGWVPVYSNLNTEWSVWFVPLPVSVKSEVVPPLK